VLGGAIFGRMGACREAKRCYAALAATPGFRTPLAWADVEPAAYDGLILPGGHAQGMRQYVDSAVLQRKVTELWKARSPGGRDLPRRARARARDRSRHRAQRAARWCSRRPTS
jgi:hypothetical protein